MMGLPSNKSRNQGRRIARQIIERKRLALIEVFGKDDAELHERLSNMSYAQIVAEKNAGHLTNPELPIEGEGNA